MQAFDYQTPKTVADAVKAAGAADAKILAGGQSLLASMKLGLAAPAALVDLGARCALCLAGDPAGDANSALQSRILDRLDLGPVSCQVIVDQLPGDADLSRKQRQVVGCEPPGIGNFGIFELDLAAGIGGVEADHQRMGKRPRLATEIANIGHLDAGFFEHLALRGESRQLQESEMHPFKGCRNKLACSRSLRGYAAGRNRRGALKP